MTTLQALQDEMKARRPKSDQLCEAGRHLIADKHPEGAVINTRIVSLMEHWATLQELAAVRKKQLEDAAEAYQVRLVARYMGLLPFRSYSYRPTRIQKTVYRKRELRF